MKISTRNLVAAALLTALGIIIPMFMPFPFKVLIEPASFTLASHVPIFIAMFISPLAALIVAIGTAFGFFISMPVVIAARALSHIVFALAGAYLLKKGVFTLKKPASAAILAVILALIHAVCEVLSVIPFYFTSSLASGFYDKGFVTAVLGLVGGGTVIHSLVDFAIAYGIWRVLARSRLVGTDRL